MIRSVLLLVSSLFAAVATYAQPLPLDSCIRSGKLSNGLTYYIRYNAQTKGQADFYIAQRVGSILEEPQQRGLAHFLEHMAFNGTRNFPDGNGGTRSVRNWCETNGIKFGADLNAYTSIDQTVYNISNAPVSKAGVTDTCLIILHDWASGLLLRDNEIDQERGVIREEWRTRRSKFASTRMMEEAMPIIYEGSKYADCLPIGHIEVVDTFHYEALRDYYRKWYRPDLQAIIVVGDIDVDAVEAKINSLFSQDTTTGKPERVYYNVPDNDEMIVYTKSDDEQPTLNLSLFMKRDAEPRSSRNTREAFVGDYKSRLAMFILRQRLARLSQEANPKLMSTSCRNGNFYITPEKEAFSLTIGLLPDRPQEGIDAAIAVVEKARRYGFTEGELEHAKVQHTVSIEHKLDNKDKTRNGEYVKSIVNSFCGAAPCMNIEYEAALEAQLSQQITLEDINATIRDIVVDKNQVCVVFGPTRYDGKSFVMPKAEQFKTWIEAAQKRDYTNDNDSYKTPDQSFIKKLPKKGKIVCKHQSTNGYTEYLLSNGIKVSARASDIEPNRLTVKMFRAGGQSLYSDDDADAFRLLNSVIRQSGAGDFDFLTLEKKRRGKALRVTPYIEDEEEGVNGVCVASDFKTWLEVAYLYLTQPRKDEGIFNNTISKQISLLKNRTANPNVIYNDSLRAAVYGKSKRTEPLTIERLQQVSLDRIYEIYKERFADLSGMHLIVTGDIRQDEFEDLLCQYVASLPGKNAKTAPAVGKNTLDITKGQVTNVFEEEMKTPSALSTIVYSAQLPYTADNDLKLDVLSQIMRAVYTEKVREEKGGTYGVSVKGQYWKYPADGCSLTVNFRCAPEKYPELLPIIDEQLRIMSEQGPSALQLDKVKEYERKNYDRAILTNGWWEYVRYHEICENIDFEKDYINKVNALTADDIRDFCKLLISDNNRIQVTMKNK